MFPLLIVAIFFIYNYFLAIKGKDKIYYFPQIEIYLKVYKPPFNKYGYVIFSKDSVFTFSKKIDYVKVYKSEISLVSFVFNPAEHHKFYIIDKWNNAQINQVNFIMEKINRENTTFFEHEIISGICTQILKPTYFEISVDGFLQSVYYSDYNGIQEYMIKAEPIK